MSPCTVKRFRRHVAFGIEIAVERLAGREAVDQLDAADLDQPMPGNGIEAGGFGIEHDLAHANLERRSVSRRPGQCRRRAAAMPHESPSPSRILCTSRRMSRTCARAWSSSCELSTTKSARRRFSASGICLREQAPRTSPRSSRRARARARAALGRRRHHHHGVAEPLAAGLEQQRNVEHDDRRAAAPAPRRGTRPAPRAPADARWLRACRARVMSPSTRRGELARDRPCRRRSYPGNAASISGDRLAFVERVHRRVGVVHRHALLGKQLAVVDLPMPIEPVRPRTNVRWLMRAGIRAAAANRAAAGAAGPGW